METPSPDGDCAFGSETGAATLDEAKARTTDAPNAPAGNTTARALARRFRVAIDVVSLTTGNTVMPDQNYFEIIYSYPGELARAGARHRLIACSVARGGTDNR
jgi:hypothetical protein